MDDVDDLNLIVNLLMAKLRSPSTSSKRRLPAIQRIAKCHTGVFLDTIVRHTQVTSQPIFG